MIGNKTIENSQIINISFQTSFSEMMRDSTNILFRYNESPMGHSLPIWTSMWWKWINSIPQGSNPAKDLTGEYSGVLQANPNVWFLAGTYGGSARRKCEIPYGKAILFPIITSTYSFATDPHLRTDKELMIAVSQDLNKVEQLLLRIDDISFSQFDEFRVQSEPFQDRIGGVDTRVVSDGYWVFMKPPTIGNHYIHFVGRNIDFFNEVHYDISIVPSSTI